MFNTLTRMGASGAGGAYEIERSLRFNSGDDAYLNMTPPTDGNMTTWTFSCWVKRGLLRQNYNSHHYIFQACPEDGKRTALYWMQGDTATASDADCLTFQYYGGSGATNYHKTTTAKYRDVSGWYHIVAVWDTTNGTAGDRMRLWVNGSRITSWVHNIGDPPQHQASHVNDASYVHSIGRRTHNTDNYLDGYLAEVNFVDGQALDASSFGETNEDTGQWIPKKYAGAYGDEGFYLKFDDNSGTTATTLGKDSSGNGNNWTPNNFSVSAGTDNDSFEDTPTNNFPTFNPVNAIKYNANYAPIVEQGNLLMRGADNHVNTTFVLPKSGKWYFECSKYGDGATQDVGITDATADLRDFDGALGAAKKVAYLSNGENCNRARGDTSDATAWTNDADALIGVAVDMDNGAVYFAHDNTWQNSGDPTSGASKTGAFATDLLTYGSKDHVPSCAGANGNDTKGMWINFGQRAFTYTPPTGYQKLCSKNLPEPTITKGTEYFNTVLYTGNGAVKTVTGVGFQPDLLINKRRDAANVSLVVDSVRGVSNGLSTALADGEYTSRVASFNSDGFVSDNGSWGQINTNNATYAAWNWKESASAGFDIVAYTGNGSNRTIAHSLGAIPECMLVKNRDVADSWQVYHHKSNAVPEDYTAFLDQASGFYDDIVWNDTKPTSSVFHLGTEDKVNANGETFINYLFTGVEGYSKFGSYIGNGSADGPYVHTGFKPAWLLVKGGGHWLIQHNKVEGYNPTKTAFLANAENAEEALSAWATDFVSNGFKVRGSGANRNQSGVTFIYMAFAESPFKYNRAE